jgi:hypothetical protein
MALLHMDGCDTYSVTADAAARYAGSNAAGMGFSTTGGRFGGGAIAPGVLTNAQPSYLGGVAVAHSGSAAIIAGGAVLPTTSFAGPVLCFYNSTAGAGTTTELYIDYSSGLFRLYRGYQATLLATATVSHVAQMWHHFEAKAVVADSGGSCEIRVNGQTIINYSGDTRQSTTGTAGIDRVYFCSPASSVPGGGAWDDFYVMDTSGSALNDFIGDCRVNTLQPTSDVAVAFTRSTGASNYLTVDEGRQNGDTDYVETALGAGTIDRYGYSDLSAAVGTVRAVQAITWARKTDAATRTMRNIVVSGGTTSTGTSYPLLTSYAPYVTLLTTDPATAAAWTPSAVNAVTAGVEVVS